MTPYYVTLFLVVITSMSAEYASVRADRVGMHLKQQNAITKIMLFLTVAILVFVAGCRYYVGTDYGAYYKGFDIYAPHLSSTLKKFDEPGFPLIAAFLKNFTTDGAYLVFAASLITISLLIVTAYKYETSYLFVTVLFIFVGIWVGTFNGVKQYLASAVLFAGHRYIYEKKFFKYALTVFIATAFHRTAVVMIALYFLLRNKINFRNLILTVAGVIFVSLNYDLLFSFIGTIKDESVSMNTYSLTTVNSLRILVACSPAVFCLFRYAGKDLPKDQVFYINSLIIHAAAMTAARNSAYVARIGLYTSPFLTIAIPKLIRMNNKQLERTARVVILILYAIYCYVEISGGSTTKVFHWIWQRDILGEIVDVVL